MPEYVVSDEALLAVYHNRPVGTVCDCKQIREDIEAFIRWQSENPPSPSSRDIPELMAHPRMFEEWIRRMYLSQA
jgi:hypothetical protein